MIKKLTLTDPIDYVIERSVLQETDRLKSCFKTIRTYVKGRKGKKRVRKNSGTYSPASQDQPNLADILGSILSNGPKK